MTKAKLLAFATAAALLAGPAFAQTSPSTGASTDDANGLAAGNADASAPPRAPDCDSLTGAQKERCLREQRGSSSGGTMGGGMMGDGMRGHGGMMNGGGMGGGTMNGGGMMGGGSQSGTQGDSGNSPTGDHRQH